MSVRDARRGGGGWRQDDVIGKGGGDVRGDVSNSGTIVYGGWINATNVAGGSGAKVQQRGMGEIADCLRELTDAVMEQSSSIDNYPEVHQATSRLATELEREEPRQRRVMRLLGVIAQGAGSVTSVASAVESLRTAVLAVL
jgi:hypothetical protein